LSSLRGENGVAGLIVERALDDDRAVAERLVSEDPADRRAVLARDFLERAEHTRDFLDVCPAQLLALAAQALPHLLPEAARVNELDFPLPRGRLPIGDDPDVRRDPGVVEVEIPVL
jgi:hypothetical protein